MMWMFRRIGLVAALIMVALTTLDACGDDPCHNGWMGGDYVMGPCGCYTAGDGNGCARYGDDDPRQGEPTYPQVDASADARRDRDLADAATANDGDMDADAGADADAD
jgi:hypothetical protein